MAWATQTHPHHRVSVRRRVISRRYRLSSACRAETRVHPITSGDASRRFSALRCAWHCMHGHFPRHTGDAFITGLPISPSYPGSKKRDYLQPHILHTAQEALFSSYGASMSMELSLSSSRFYFSFNGCFGSNGVFPCCVVFGSEWREPFSASYFT